MRNENSFIDKPPAKVGGAKVVLCTKIDERHQFTGNCKQIVAGVLLGAVSGLAICQYEGDEGYYLFGCDENWNALTDTYRTTLEQARGQAGFEYAGTLETWQNL